MSLASIIGNLAFFVIDGVVRVIGGVVGLAAQAVILLAFCYGSVGNRSRSLLS